jgi:homoserine/homoserine lactone efflux protein
VHLATLTAFIALEVVLCFIPGPAVLSVLGAALSRGERAGFATAVGILIGNALYFVVSALGLASIIVASHAAFLTIKWCGALYLAYLGLRALFSHRQAATTIPQPPSGNTRGAWVNGTVVQLSNPKALIFFTAILPQFIDPRADVPVQLAILGLAGLAVEFGVLSLYIVSAGRIRRQGLNLRSQLWAERLGGAFLLTIAAAVARESL